MADFKDQPIVVPPNPFWKVFMTFGRDEFYAIILSMVATGLVMLGLNYWKVDAVTAAALLALAGPIFEKFGFFIGHIKDAFDVYNTTASSEREPLSHYVKQAFRGGMKSLIYDILVHDPIYIALMFGGMYFNPATPAWLLVPVAFGVAVVIVAGVDVGLTELRYWLLQRELKAKPLNFKRTPYYESWFVVKAEDHTKDAILNDLYKFYSGAIPSRTIEYIDYYLETDLKEYNGRIPHIRLRTKKHSGGATILTCSAQIIYTRTIEQDRNSKDQHRLFPQYKEKYTSLTNGPIDDVSQIKAPFLRSLLRKITTKDKPYKTVEFSRKVYSDGKTIFIAVDDMGDGTLVIELKVFADQLTLLKRAMRYVMHNYKVVQTTHNKTAIIPDDLKAQQSVVC